MELGRLVFLFGCLFHKTEAITCYNCAPCGDTEGSEIDCAAFGTSNSCYALLSADEEVTKYCGNSDLDELGLPLGCYSANGITACRCVTDSCNTNSLLLSSGGSEATTEVQATTHSITQSTEVPPSSTQREPTQFIKSTSSSSWYCYVCNDCSESTSQLVDCSTSTNSRSCLLTKDSSGKVNQTCGRDSSDTIQRVDSCETVGGVTICECFEHECNTVQRLLPMVTSTPISEASTIYCHVCVNCGRSLGPVLPCAMASSCSLSIVDGKVTRSCGQEFIDHYVPEDRGCKTAADYTICKCSTSQCNVFPGITRGITGDSKSIAQAEKHQQTKSNSITLHSGKLLSFTNVAILLFLLF